MPMIRISKVKKDCAIRSRDFGAQILLITTLFLSSAVPGQGLIHEEKGTPADLVRAHIDTVIPEDSEMYIPPSDAEIKEMKQLVSQVLISSGTDDAVKLSESSFEAAQLGYELLKLTNEKTGSSYYILREAAGNNKGWGLYIFRAGSDRSDLVIETPHPLYDLNTDRIGILAFEKSRAKAFLLAGTHRNANRDGSGDVAHSLRSIFQAVHEQVTTSSTTVIQIHGFTLVKEPGYPQIVLSSTGPDTSLVSELSSILETKNFTVGIANGGKFRQLEGTNNIQGKYAGTAGATFIHMELENSIRNYPSKYRQVITAISDFDSRGSRKPEIDRFSNLLKQELWYYLIPVLVMIGASLILLLEKRNLKSRI